MGLGLVWVAEGMTERGEEDRNEVDKGTVVGVGV